MMKITSQIFRKSMLLAIASGALITPLVHGQTVTASTSELILGFRATGNPGQTVNLEVNLGSIYKFYATAPGTTISLPNLAIADLVANYGANWFNRTDLYWGAIGSTTSFAGWTSNSFTVAARTMWASAPDNTPPWPRGSSTAHATPVSKILTLLSGAPGSLNGAASTANSASSAIIDASLAGSWSVQEGADPVGICFAFFQSPGVNNVGASNSVISQLYELQPGSGFPPAKLLGNLIFTPTGLSFQAAGGGGAPVIGVSGNLAFGNVITGTTSTASLTITNSGTVTMTVSNITYPSGFSGAFSGTIAAGSATNVTVTFAPVALISYSGNVTVNSDATSGTSTIAASGTGTAVATRIVGLSGNLAFGNVITGTTATATLTITNTGNAALTVSNLSYPAGFSGAFSGTIAAGGSSNITVTFAPVALISYSGNVTVSSDATSGTSTIAISGTGTAPAATRIIGLSGSLAFGNVITGTTATASLTISNIGNATLTVSSIAYPSGFSGAFSGTIAAGSTSNITVTFAPVALISYSGNVTVNSDATSGTNTRAASGTGTAAPAPVVGLSGNLAFGNVTTGTTATASLIISNIGNATLTVSSITYPSGFSGAFSGTVAAGGAHTTTVTFAPLALTSFGGTVTVNSDALSGINTVSASGTGSVLVARIIGVSGNLVFGSVITGTTSTATMTISNTGNASLTVSSITYPSGFSGAFSGGIAAGGSQNVTVTFAPSALISYSGNVTVNSDKTAGTSTIAASGTGIPIPTRIIGLSGNLAFGTVITGTTQTATMTISNAGNTTLTVSGITYPSGFSGAFSGGIAAGGSQSVTVTFAPDSLISYSGTVTVNSDKTSGTSTIAASGTGATVPNLPPVFVLGPRVNNAVLSNGTLFVVVADTQAVFIAAATDPNSDPVSYSWNFGDGDTATGDLVQHTYSACGPFSASAVASDGSLSNTAPLTVSVACQFDTNATTKLQMKVNFAKPDADSVKFQGEVGLDPAFAITGKQVLLSVGDATLAFVLDSQGKGTNPLGKFQIKFNSKTGNWTVKASFSKGTWRTPWATYGLTNTTNAKPGVAVTVPVILVVGSDSFMIDRVLTYTSTEDKSGQAK